MDTFFPGPLSVALGIRSGAAGEYVRLRDGKWTMGGVFLVNPAALEANRLHIERVFAARKSQIAMARLLDGSSPQRAVEFRVRHSDGSWRHVELAPTNLLEDPAVAGVVCNVRDITERRRAEEELSLLQTVVVAVNEAADLDSALGLTVQRLCETSGWACGAAPRVESIGPKSPRRAASRASSRSQTRPCGTSPAPCGSAAGRSRG